MRTTLGLRPFSQHDDAVARLSRQAALALHSRLDATPDRVYLANVARTHRLSRIDIEVLLACCLAGLGMGEDGDGVSFDLQRLQAMLVCDVREAVRAARAVGPGSRLVRAELVDVEMETAFFSSAIGPAEAVIRRLVTRKAARDPWDVRTQDAFLERCRSLVDALATWSSHGQRLDSSAWSEFRSRGAAARVARLRRRMMRVLREHRDWPLARLQRSGISSDELVVVLILLGLDLGWLGEGHDLVRGDGIAHALRAEAAEERADLTPLRRTAPLRSRNLVRICPAADSGVVAEDDSFLSQATFELTRGTLSLLGVQSRRRRAMSVRPPLLRWDQIVLAPHVERALDLAAVQAGQESVLFERWGLGTAFPYGRGMTMLFSGPPGVGKTAAAEALAHRLGRPILVASYAEIESPWLGETEKNVVRVFAEAHEADALLFWDEADSLFVDRSRVQHGWEARQVNVLLLEIEKFAGPCVLATNRKPSLDPALDRRIALKLEFPPPDVVQARRLWSTLLPTDLPLAPDVDLDALASAGLVGGRIKNVVLNAARLALARGKRSRVMMADFREAMDLERAGGMARARAGSGSARGGGARDAGPIGRDG